MVESVDNGGANDPQESSDREELFNRLFVNAVLGVLTILLTVHLVLIFTGSPMATHIETVGVIVGAILIAYCMAKIPNHH